MSFIWIGVAACAGVGECFLDNHPLNFEDILVSYEEFERVGLAQEERADYASNSEHFEAAELPNVEQQADLEVLPVDLQGALTHTFMEQEEPSPAHEPPLIVYMYSDTNLSSVNVDYPHASKPIKPLRRPIERKILPKTFQETGVAFLDPLQGDHPGIGAHSGVCVEHATVSGLGSGFRSPAQISQCKMHPVPAINSSQSTVALYARTVPPALGGRLIWQVPIIKTLPPGPFAPLGDLMREDLNCFQKAISALTQNINETSPEHEKSLYQYTTEVLEPVTYTMKPLLALPKHVFDCCDSFTHLSFAIDELLCDFPEFLGMLCNEYLNTSVSRIIVYCGSRENISAPVVLLVKSLELIQRMGKERPRDLSGRFKNVLRAALCEVMCLSNRDCSLNKHYKSFCEKMLIILDSGCTYSVFAKVEFMYGLCVLYPHTYEVKRKIEGVKYCGSGYGEVILHKLVRPMHDSRQKKLSDLRCAIFADISYLRGVESEINGPKKYIRLKSIGVACEVHKAGKCRKEAAAIIKNVYELYARVSSIICCCRASGLEAGNVGHEKSCIKVADLIRFLERLAEVIQMI